MLMENRVTNTPTIPSPFSTGVLYEGTTIQVPVFADVDDSKVFAPPFLIPQGTWDIVYTLQTPGWLFRRIEYFAFQGTDFPSGVTLGTKEPGDMQFTTPITNNVQEVNMLGCTISVVPASAPPGFEAITGDPTIAVVKEPIDG